MPIVRRSCARPCQTWQKASLDGWNLILLKYRVFPDSKGRYLHMYKIAKYHWRNFKISFSRTTGVISTKLGTKHPWVNGGFRFVQTIGRALNYKIAKIHRRNSKKMYTPEPLNLFQSTLVQSIVKNLQRGPVEFSKKKEFCLSPNHCFDIIICGFWFELFFRRGMANRPILYLMIW